MDAWVDRSGVRDHFVQTQFGKKPYAIDLRHTTSRWKFVARLVGLQQCGPFACGTVTRNGWACDDDCAREIMHALLLGGYVAEHLPGIQDQCRLPSHRTVV